MKKTFICLIVVMVLAANPVYGKETGHALFEEIQFSEYSTAKLLVDMTIQEKMKAHRELTNRKFIGWTIHTMNRKAEANYVAETIFSRSNATTTAYEFNYLLKEGTEIETSISADGNISTKNKGKIKMVETALDVAIRGQIGKKEKTARSEETRIKVMIEPNRKISMKIVGEALVSNGVGKYYFFGICFKSGEWEYIDVLSRYYELCEEVIRP